MSNFDNLQEAYPDDRTLVSALNYIEARLVDAIRPHQDPQDQVLLSNNLPNEQREQNNQFSMSQRSAIPEAPGLNGAPPAEGGNNNQSGSNQGPDPSVGSRAPTVPQSIGGPDSNNSRRDRSNGHQDDGSIQSSIPPAPEFAMPNRATNSVNGGSKVGFIVGRAVLVLLTTTPSLPHLSMLLIVKLREKWGSSSLRISAVPQGAGILSTTVRLVLLPWIPS